MSRSQSGKFVIRMDPKLHRHLKELGVQKGKSLNEICLEKLQHGHEGAHHEMDSLVNSLEKQFKYDLLAIILFGSSARGEAKKSSDKDLLIVLDKAAEIRPVLYKKWNEINEDPLDLQLSPHFIHFPADLQNPGSFWFEIAIDGKVLWERNSCAHDILQKIRETIATGRWKRKFSHGQPYWIFSKVG